MTVIDELFGATAIDIDKVKSEDIRLEVVLHEAGHILAADYYNIPVDNIYIPSLLSYSQENNDCAGVTIFSPECPQLILFFLAGLYGEMSPYSNLHIDRYPLDLSIAITGAIGDLQQAAQRSNQPIQSAIEQAVKEWEKKPDARAFLALFHKFYPAEFQVFRQMRDQHRNLAGRLYGLWEQQGFTAFDVDRLSLNLRNPVVRIQPFVPR
jgi:hypothetical protein